MTDAELNALSLPELLKLQKEIGRAIRDFDGHKKTGAIAALEEKAREFCFKRADLLGLDASKKLRPAVPKYRHPENSEVTWSGRGRKPLWGTSIFDCFRDHGSASFALSA